MHPQDGRGASEGPSKEGGEGESEGEGEGLHQLRVSVGDVGNGRAGKSGVKTRLQEAKPDHVSVNLTALEIEIEMMQHQLGAGEDDADFRTPPAIVEEPSTPPAPRKPVQRVISDPYAPPRGTCRRLDFSALYIDNDAEEGTEGDTSTEQNPT